MNKKFWMNPTNIGVIISFVIVHILIVKSMSSFAIDAYKIIDLLVGVSAFYFKIFLFDKASEDRKISVAMIFCIIAECLSFYKISTTALISMIIATTYSLIMFKEFFIRDIIRPYLTMYTLLHTVVMAILSITVFSALTNTPFLEVAFTPPLLSFALANWLLFNVIEFGRKSRAKSEEVQNVDTYSSIFGPIGAVILMASQVLIAHFMATTLNGFNHPILFWGFGLILLALTIVSALYIMVGTAKAAENYRRACSIYIVFFHTVIITSYLII